MFHLSHADGFDRVRAHGSKRVNARLDDLAEENLARAARTPEIAAQRMLELEREWDIDRAILIPFAAMGTVALLLALRRDRRWRIPLIAQLGNILLYAAIGWCPPALVLRQLGFRTRQEIDAERAALFIAYSDFE